jgi:radical SAM protein with 4Fe4S-binding SPASM domain
MNIDSNETYTNILKYYSRKRLFKDRDKEKSFIDTFAVDVISNNKCLVSSPLWVGLKVTPYCNMKCIHCWADLKGEVRTKNEIFDAIDKFRNLQVLHVTLSGGEPFLRDDIFEVIEYVKAKRMCLEMFTNGTFLTKEVCNKLDRILNKDTDSIQVSFDAASSDTYKAQRGINKLEKVIQGIKLAKEYGLTVRTNFTATPINVKEIYDSYKMANDLNVDTFSISHVYDLHKGVDLYDSTKLEEYLAQINKCIVHESEFNTKLRIFTPMEFLAMNSKVCENLDNDLKIINYDLLLTWFINSNGDIYPDVTLEVDKLKIGNIYDNTVEEITNNAKKINEYLYERNLTKEKCKRCSSLPLCKGGDIGRAYRYYGDINYADPRCDFKIEGDELNGITKTI